MEHRIGASAFKLPCRYSRLLSRCWPSYFLVGFPPTSSADQAQLSGAPSGCISYYPHLDHISFFQTRTSNKTFTFSDWSRPKIHGNLIILHITFSRCRLRDCQGVCIFFKTPRPVLGFMGFTEPHIQSALGFCRGDKAAGTWGWPPPPCSTEVKNE